MIALWLGLASAGTLTFERVDLFAEEGSGWWVDDAPRLGVTPRVSALRWALQVRFAARMTERPWVFAASVAQQSIGLRRATSVKGLFGSALLHTRLGLPSGVSIGAEYWRGPVRLGLGVHVDTGMSWGHLRPDGLRVLPAVALGFGHAPRRW